MAIEIINIRVYNSSGGIDASLSPAIVLYDNLDDSVAFSWTMVWNATTLSYRFSPNIDTTKTYTATIDFGVSALTRYISFGVSYTGSSSGTWSIVQEIWEYPNKPLILHLHEKVSQIV